MRRHRGAVYAALLGLVIAGCRPSAEAVAQGDDPLAALSVRAESTRYDGPFWAHEAHRGSAVWLQARSYCLKHREEDLPNCQPVGLVVRWERPEALPPLGPPPMPTIPPPPVYRSQEKGYVAGDVEALRRWEQALTQGNQPPPGGAVR